MTLRFLSPQTAAMARDVSLLGLLSESIDANADTVCLITGDQRTELEWLVHYDYHRALQRLGHETRPPRSARPGLAPLGARARRGGAGRAAALQLGVRRVKAGTFRPLHNHTQPQTTTPPNARVAKRCGSTREEVLPADATHERRTVELVAFSLLARDLP